MITCDSNNLINLRLTVQVDGSGYLQLVKATQKEEKLKQGCDLTRD